MKSIQIKYTLLNTLFWFSLSIILPVYVIMLEKQVRLDYLQIAAALAVTSVAVFVFEFPSGLFADWFGRKGTFMIACSILAASMLILFFSQSFITVLPGMFLFGTGRAFSSGSLEAWFIDAIHEKEPKEDIQPYLAKAGMFSLFGVALGSILGGVLAQEQLFSGIPSLKLPLIAVAVFYLITVFLTSILIKESKHITNKDKHFSTLVSNLKNFLTFIKGNKKILTFFGIFALIAIGGSSLEMYYQPHFSTIYKLEGKELYLGFIMAGAFALSALGSILSIPLGKLFKGRHHLTAAVYHLIFGGSILIMGLAGIGYIPLIGIFLAYGVKGGFESPYATLYNAELKSEFRSSGISALSMAAYFGGFIAVLFGIVAKYVSIPAVWIISGMLMLFSSVIVVFLYRGFSKVKTVAVNED